MGTSSTLEKNVSGNYSNCNFDLWIYIWDITRFWSLTCSFRTNDSSWVYNYTTPVLSKTSYGLVNGWNHLELSQIMFVASNANASWASVNAYRIRINWLASGQFPSVTLDDFKAVNMTYGPKVTLRFDDGLSDLMTAKKYMDVYGYKGDLAIPTNKIGSAGYISLANLTTLYQQGWEPISHTQTHTIASNLTLDGFEEELMLSQNWLLQNGFTKGARFFIFPNQWSNSSYVEIAQKYYQGIFYWKNAVTTKEFDNFLFGSQMTTLTYIDLEYNTSPYWNEWSTIKGWIDNLINTNGYTTIVIHSIDETTFPTLLRYLYDNGVEVVTYSQVATGLVGATTR